MRWAPVGAVLLLVVGVVGFALSNGGGGADADSLTAVSTAPGGVATSIGTQPLGTAATTAPIQKTTLSRTIDKGMSGDDVTAIQERLVELGYDPGPVDGSYGHLTISAVWAFKKLVMDVDREKVTDEVTPELWDRMQDPIVVKPRRPQGTGNHIEIYLPIQVMIVFHDDAARLITHISSGELDENGDPKPYCEDIVKTIDENGVPLEEPIAGESCGVAKTPGGVFKIGRMEQGPYQGALGGMWDPVYFNYGIAIHGAMEIPLYPASHGCIRIERHIGEYFQDLIGKGDTVYVWNGLQEPEEVSKEDALPRFDQFTPESTAPPTAAPTSAPAVETTPAPAATTTTRAPAPVTTTTQAPATTTTTQAPTTSTSAAPDADSQVVDDG